MKTIRWYSAVKKTHLFFIFIGCFFINAHADPDIDLAFCIDGSGSMSAAEFQQQLDGTAAAIENSLIVPQDGTVRVSVFQFNSNASIDVSPTVITPATAANVATAIRGIVQIPALTNMSACINLASSTILSAVPASTRQIIDMSTDGRPTQPTLPISPESVVTVAANAAQTSGIDALNALLIGNLTDSQFMAGLVFPQPDGGNNGFTVKIDNFNEFADAIAQKIRREIAVVPPVVIPPVVPPVIPPVVPSVTSIPTLNEWGLIILAFTLFFVSLLGSKPVTSSHNTLTANS